MNKKLIYAFMFLLLAIIVVLINLFFKKGDTVKENIKIVTNNSDFYTVSSCLERVGNYLSTKNSENIYLITSETYKKNNSFNKENILSKYSSFEVQFTIIPKKMYYSNISESIVKYYVYVNYVDVYYNNTLGDGYIIVYLDKDKGLFSIEPYDGHIFKDGVSNE